MAPIGYTPRPAKPLLGCAFGLCDIYMLGDSVKPRYEQGSPATRQPVQTANPGSRRRRPQAGPERLIKQFVGCEGDVLVLRQLNPPDTLRIPRGPRVRMPPCCRHRSRRMRSAAYSRAAGPSAWARLGEASRAAVCPPSGRAELLSLQAAAAVITHRRSDPCRWRRTGRWRHRGFALRGSAGRAGSAARARSPLRTAGRRRPDPYPALASQARASHQPGSRLRSAE